MKMHCAPWGISSSARSVRRSRRRITAIHTGASCYSSPFTDFCICSALITWKSLMSAKGMPCILNFYMHSVCPERYNMVYRLSRRFKFAFLWLKTMLKKDMHVLSHMIVTVLVILLGLFFSLEKVEWLFIISAIFAVVVTEVMNTSVEYTVDVVTGDYKEYI